VLSGTVNLCKVFESFMRNYIIDHIEKYKLMKDFQHGFVRKKIFFNRFIRARLKINRRSLKKA